MANKLKSIKKKKLNILIIVALFVVVGAGLIIYSNAATPTIQTQTATTLANGPASLKLNPASGAYSSGATIDAGIYVDSGTSEISTVDVKLNYDTTKMDFVSIDGTGGSFSTCTEATGGSGNASLVCTKLGGFVSGNQKIGNVKFRTKVNTGTSAVNFSSSSHVYAYAATLTEMWNGETAGGTYTLGTTTGGGGSGGGGTTPPTSGGGGGTTTPTTGTSGGSKTTPKTTTTTPSTPSGSSPATPNTTPVDTSSPTGDSSVGTPETTASTSTTPKKLDTNTIIIYAAVIGGGIAILSASGVAFTKMQRKNKYNRAHGITNSAVVFDANSSVHNPQTNSIDQGPMIAPTAPATPKTPPVETKGPEGNIITPNDTSAS